MQLIHCLLYNFSMYIMYFHFRYFVHELKGRIANTSSLFKVNAFVYNAYECVRYTRPA